MITGTLTEKIIKEQNLIYCSTINLTWNVLSEYFKGEITFDKVCETVNFLNKRSFTKEHLCEDSYIAIADTVKNNVFETIVETLKTKFNETSRCNLDRSSYSETDIIAYSFLLKILAFKKKFGDIKDFKFANKAVKAFGIKNVREDTEKKLLNQVRIYDYKNDDDFIVSLVSEKDFMILAKIPNECTLEQTLQSVQQRIKQNSVSYLQPNESLIIPKLDFDLEHHFSELIGKNIIVNKQNKDYFIADAVQFIKFVLNEEGAKLRSEAMITSRKCSISIPKQYRKFIFDKPFLLYLAEKHNYPPYFVTWVGNSDIMVIDQ